jgi:hypothetical protein
LTVLENVMLPLVTSSHTRKKSRPRPDRP